MSDGRRRNAKNLSGLIRDFRDCLTKTTHVIEQDFPLYVKEGNHRVLISCQDNEKDNSIYTYDVNFSVLEGTKGVLGYLVTYEEGKESDDLQEIEDHYNNLKAEKEIAASYVHEIKNPIFTVRGFLQILQQSFDLDDKRKKYTDIAINELDRVNDLLNEFLAQYREFTSSDEQNHKGVLVKPVIEELIAFFQYNLGIRDINFELNIDDKLFVRINKDHLVQILINILQNSIESMNESTRLAIKAYQEKECVFIEIQDEGTGIKQEQMDKIFDPAFTTKEKGTGLGLHITKKIVGNYGGNIYLKSVEGKGTTCYLKFPLKP